MASSQLLLEKKCYLFYICVVQQQYDHLNSVYMNTWLAGSHSEAHSGNYGNHSPWLYMARELAAHLESFQNLFYAVGTCEEELRVPSLTTVAIWSNWLRFCIFLFYSFLQTGYFSFLRWLICPSLLAVW